MALEVTHDPGNLPPDRFAGIRSLWAHQSPKDYRVAQYRAGAALPLHAQELFDTKVKEVGLKRRGVVAALRKGDTFSIPNWIAVLELVWQKISRSGSARMVMLPSSRGTNALPDFGTDRMPLLCTISDFNFHERLLAASQRSGQPLDTRMISQETTNVFESLENQAIYGAPSGAGTLSAPGLLNANNVNTHEILVAWTDPAVTGLMIYNDVQAMIAIEEANRRFGKYRIGVNTSYNRALDADYKNASSSLTMTIRQRLMTIEGVEEIFVADFLPANVIVMWCIDPNVVDYVVGSDPTHISWGGQDPWTSNHAVIACGLVRPLTDYELRSGVVVGFKA
jgi:hypothetical protein